MRNLHCDPRWLPFLRKLGLAPEQLAAIKFDVKGAAVTAPLQMTYVHLEKSVT